MEPIARPEERNMSLEDMLSHNLNSLQVIAENLRPKVAKAEAIIEATRKQLSRYDFLFTGGWELNIDHSGKSYTLAFFLVQDLDRLRMTFCGKELENLTPKNKLVLAGVLPDVVAFLVHEADRMLHPILPEKSEEHKINDD